MPPSRIFQSVAAGLLGEASFLIACTMAVTYYVAARRWPLLARRPVVLGIAYGLLLYLVMNHIVVPLSAASPGSSDPTWITLTVAAHGLLVGVPIAWFTGRAVGR